MHSFIATPKSVECALFLPEHQRTEHVFEAMSTIHQVLFEELGYDQSYFRRGALGKDAKRVGELLGTSFPGILRRQMLVEDGASTNLYSMTREQWPSATLAAEGWLASHPIVQRKS
ncbi:hypothetical protein LTS10_001172 [Elasticomyces elasticus]|nr:hypothetical protein LTS10_001172 [Elasticomyces elasticus]